MFWLFDHQALGILVPWSGIEPATSAWEGHILTGEPPAKSPQYFLKQAQKKKKGIFSSLTHPKLLEQCFAQSCLNEWPNQSEDSSLHLPYSHWVNIATNLKLREEKQAVVGKAVTDNYTGKTPKEFELDLKMHMTEIAGFPGGAMIIYQCRRHNRRRFNP